MKNLIILCLLGISVLFSGCNEDPMISDVSTELKGAKKPLPSLVGAGDILFTLTPPTFWNGVVDFGDAGEYKITFISLGDGPRDFSQASPFAEDIVIYDMNASWPPSEAEIYLTASCKGVVTYANKIPEPSKFLENGVVTGAFGPLEDWMGCTMHIKGIVIWAAPGLPAGAVNTIRIN
jgi:hypothetical protein